MNISDDELVAFVDGELDPARHAALLDHAAQDPALAERIERHRALRERIAAAYAEVLDEPVPIQLLRTARDSTGAPADASPSGRGTASRQRRWRWAHVGAIAASVVLGVALGSYLTAQRAVDSAGSRTADAGLALDGGALAATGALGDALEHQLANAPRGDVDIALTFVSREGQYCRAFTQARAGTAGIACREGARWRIALLAAAPAAGDELRQAGSALPAAVIEEVERGAAGDTLSVVQESRARANAWQPDHGAR